MTLIMQNPWNWFKKEREQEKMLPVHSRGRGRQNLLSPLDQIHTDIDRIVESMFSDFGISPRSIFNQDDLRLNSIEIKPKIDVYGTDKEYVIEADLPGIDEKDLSLELKENMLILSAEKKHEEKTEEKGYYRVERSAGSYNRVLNLPEDANKETLSAKLKNGVLCITMQRVKAPETSSKKIPIQNETTN